MGELAGIGGDEAGVVTGEIAWLDDRYLPRAEFAVPAGDTGFVLGATVTEQLRTFRGRLFLPEPHAKRLSNSLALVGLSPAAPLDTIMAAAGRVARHNHGLLAAAAPGELPPDLGLVIFVTAGDSAAQHGGRAGPPRVAIHTFPLAFGLWAHGYEAGVALRSVAVTQVPETCWPSAAKVRSRLHYFLADREAAAVEPGARAVLSHADGRVSETSTANLAVVHGGRITTPPAADALPGVSLAYARGLAEGLGIPWAERSLAAADLVTADEILLTSTPSGILPATRFDGRVVGTGRPGPVFRRLLAAWSEAAGIDIAGQARHHAGVFPPPGTGSA